MKKSKIRLLSVLAASLVAIFAAICLVGFSACDMFTSSSSSSDDDEHVHIVTLWDLEEATCEEDGSQLGTCDICGDAVMLIIPATGHDYVYEVIAEASCEEDGLQTGVCSKCGNEVTNEIPATGHEYVFEITKEATCEEEGSRIGECSVCGDTVTGTIPATGHSWDEGTVTKEATEDEEGEMTYTCTVCGKTKTETIDKLEPSGGQGGDQGEDTGDTGSGSGDTGDTGDEGDVEEDRVSATEENSEDLKAGEDLSFEAADITVTYDPATRMYTISGTSNVFGQDLANAFWGTTNGLSHAECEYITFTISANAGETIKITTYNGDTVEKVRAMYGEGVDETTSALVDENGNTIQKASDGTWIVDVTPEVEGDWRMELEIEYENGDKVTYTIVFGTIERAHQNAENARVDAPKDGDEDFSATFTKDGSETTVTFTDSEIDVSYDSSTRTYTIEGVSAKYSADQLAAMQLDGDGDDHEGCWYVSFKVTANAGETIKIKTYNGDTPENTWTLCGEGVEGESTTDGAFVLDTTNHTEGDWKMVLEVIYENGDKVTYTIVLGTVQTYCEANGHIWDDGVVTEPTCTENGYTTQTCGVCGATQVINIVTALGHDYAEIWDWSAESSGDGYDVSATLTLVCFACGDEQTVSSAMITTNSDGTYTAEVTLLDGEEYEDTSRVFIEGSDGVLTDIGMCTEYTPQKTGDEITSYVLTKVSDSTTNLVVAGYVNGLSVSVGLGGSGNAVCSRTTLKTVAFEEGVMSIASYAFYYCTSLETVVFCDTITEIGDYAFQNCSSLSGTLIFGKSLTKIGTNSFFSCTTIESIKLNDGLIEIGKCAFQKTDGLSGCLEIPSSVTTIGDNAFYQNNGCDVTCIVIHGNKESGTTIGEDAFCKYTKATMLVFDGGIFTSLGSSVFQSCNNITTLIISNGATFVDVHQKAFNNNSVIETVYFDGTADDWNSVKIFLNGYNTLITDECLVYYYSENEPEESDDSDTLYWYWGEDGTPKVWNA